MLVDEMTSSSFVKKNNSYSHCPLKKRPVTVVMPPTEEWQPAKAEIKEEAVDGADEVQEPENLSTKPEDLRKTAPKRHRSVSPPPTRPELVHYPAAAVKRSPSPCAVQQHSQKSIVPASPVSSSPLVQHHHQSPTMPSYQLNYPLYPTKANTPPAAPMPIHPAAKRVRVEVLKHDASPATVSVPLHHHHSHFMAGSGSPPTTANEPASYGPLGYGRAALHHPTPLLPYAPYCYPEAVYSTGFHVAAYAHHSSPEHHHHQQSVSPSPPHPTLTSNSYAPLGSAVQRPRPYWASPEHCGLSPTGSLRSPPLVTPEDLSSPGSDSGRSSAGSTTVGSSCSSHIKIKSPVSSTFGSSSSSSSSTSSSSSLSLTSPGSPRYKCPDCQKSYSTYSGLSKHQQFHCSAAEGQTKKSFSCKNCEKVYQSLGALKMHIRTHTLPCKCDICGKAFSRPWLLQGHIRTHTGEKPFVCQHCNRAFADRSNLRAHLQTHSDVKKYSCASCSKTFSRMSLLTKHQEGGCPGVPVSGVSVPVPVPYGC
ncbi:protein escargot-like [Copidosoma floridanum]|uniref:protein escargot-like n=1 Tax=Copidosoma floridanum TaxID=29053 RepID=UPI0006C9D32C|nr:protein escargot-like [Copidosoma floridanum]